MSNIDLLSFLGCLVIRDFLPSDSCKKLVKEILLSDNVVAGLVDNNNQIYTDDSERRTKIAQVSKATYKEMYDRIFNLKPQIESHFKVELKDCEVPQFLVYREGDFFGLHIDRNNKSSEATLTNNRKISIVIFLNKQSNEFHENCYGGGTLNLYNLLAESKWQDKGFPVSGETGLLFAFRSDTLHEVAPVLYGERFTAVSWFY